MADYLHGAYREWPKAGDALTADSQAAIVVFGTAPVHTIAGGANNVNKPILVRTIAEARKYFGYSEDWASYTLCEAMHLCLEEKKVGPLVLINVLDPTTAKGSTEQSSSLTPANGAIVMANAEDVILDTVTVTGKTKGTDYAVSYDWQKKTVVISELTPGALGTSAIAVKYYEVDTTAVTSATVIGTTDGAGLNTGIYVIHDVYQKCGVIPAFMMAPGWSSIPAVHTAMAANSHLISGHWDAWMFTDIPILDNATPVTLATAATWKSTNGYTCENETVCFPMVKGTDGMKYHMSTYRAANFMELLADSDGVPYHTASNTPAELIEALWLGATYEGRVYDDNIINEKLCKNGIASAAFVGGQWVLWGAHPADYNDSAKTELTMTETARMMLYYITNSFQQRRPKNVDKPLSANDIASIVGEEQARLDALVNVGALTYGKAYIDTENIAMSDVYSGDYVFTFDVSTMPLCKSLTARVNWVNDGYVVYYQRILETL